MVCRDRFSGVVWSYPAVTQETEKVETALRHVCGNSDRAAEILRATRDVSFPSVPGKQGTATSLLQSSLSVKHWRCPRKRSETGRGKKGKRSQTHGMKPIWDTPTKATWFLSVRWYCAAVKHVGAQRSTCLVSWSGGYCRNEVQRSSCCGFITIIERWGFCYQKRSGRAEREMVVPACSREGQGRRRGQSTSCIAGRWFVHASRRGINFRTRKGIPPTSDEPGGLGDVRDAARNIAITKLRIAVHGKTPRCSGCSFGTYNHNTACRKRFNEFWTFMSRCGNKTRMTPWSRVRKTPSFHHRSPSSCISSPTSARGGS